MSLRLMRQPRRFGFTLIELLVVLGILALLLSILLPTISKINRTTKRTQCMANLRVLTQAWTAYASMNKGHLVRSFTDSVGWVNSGNTVDNIRQGVLFEYANHPEADHCPVDPSDHPRSYSINNYLNGTAGWGEVPISLLAQIRKPSETFVFVEENDPRGYNMGSFALYPTGDSWVDWPPSWHDKGVCLSFADGHVEYYVFSDPRTATITGFYASHPGSEDLKWFQRRIGM